ILQAIAEQDRKTAACNGNLDGTRFDYSATDFRDRVFELMKNTLGEVDRERAPRPEKTSNAWQSLRNHLPKMVKLPKCRLELIKRNGKKSRYRITDAGIRYLNSFPRMYFSLEPIEVSKA